MLRLFTAASAAFLLAAPAFAEGIMIKDAYARSSGAMAKAGAAFMEIMNHSGTDDRLVSASSDISARVELHTHMETGDGIMKMMEVEEGFPIPAGSSYMLKRGGDHVMFMGLNEAMTHGETVTVTLTFEQAGDMVIDIPVDLERQDMHGHGGHGHGHGGHDHSGHNHDS